MKRGGKKLFVYILSCKIIDSLEIIILHTYIEDGVKFNEI